MAERDPNQRFVITGMGMVSSLGHDVESNWQALLNGEHGVQNVRDTLLSRFHSLPVHLAAPVNDFDLMRNPVFAEHRKSLKKWDISQQFVLWAGEQALRQARLLTDGSLKVDDRQIDPERFGVYIGTAIGGADALGDGRYILEQERETYERYQKAIIDGDEELIAKLEKEIGETRIRPTAVLNALPGRVAATPSLVFGAKAFWKGILQECASGNGAIISAVEAIKLGKADIVLAGGVEGKISPTTIGHFGAAGAASRNRNPDEASRPFDKERDGLIMGQGAGTIIVEDMDHAVNRNAPILAEIVGWAENADSMYETEPDPASVLKCIAKALKMIEKSRRKIKGVSVNTHATSTVIGDPGEMTAITMAYEPTQLVGIAAPKSGRGHSLGAAGAIEAIDSVLTLRDGKTPPIRNLNNPIPEAKGYEHLMSHSYAIEAEIEYVVNNSFGFGGNNAITIFSRPR